VKTQSTKLCECGCGEFTYLRQGQPQRFRWGHWSRLQPRAVWSKDLWEERDCGYSTACFVWQGAMTGLGYGKFGGNRMAHRIAYQRAYGAIPEGLELDHLCSNPACVRPDHLEPVTHVENLRRGRGTKLTQEQVVEIRGSSAPTRELATKYGVTQNHIWSLRRGMYWKH